MSLKLNVHDVHDGKTYSVTLNDSRVLRLMSGDHDRAVYMGLWDRFKDLFRHEKKAEVLETLWGLIHPEKQPGAPLKNGLPGACTAEDGWKYTTALEAFWSLQKFTVSNEAKDELWWEASVDNDDCLQASFHIGNTVVAEQRIPLRKDAQERLNLESADLEGAWLDGANLRGANLRGANLRGANLRGANLRGANLSAAILDNACLDKARLNNAHLEHASLDYASLDYASLDYASLDYASLDHASLDDACLDHASLYRANLDHASLDHVSLDDACLDHASLYRANLDGACMERAKLEGASFIGTSLQNARMKGVSIDDNTNFAYANLKNAVYEFKIADLKCKILYTQGDEIIQHIYKPGSRGIQYIYRSGESASRHHR